MGPRRDLRHHAAKWLVRCILADDRLGKNMPVAGDESDGTVVAGGFKTKDQSHFAPGPLPHPPHLH
jgi:hypothetical protein